MKTVIEMAREAGGLGFVHDAGDAPSKWQFTPKELKRFAELVRADAIADEREACAKVCDDRAFRFFSESPFFVEMHGLADAIRSRSSEH